jgi:trans-aconitate methyltransferase
LNLNWDAETYDKQHSFVTKYGEELIDLLDPQPHETILDIGCGTGHLTAQIAARGANAIGLDASESMLEIARSTYPDITFLHADASDFEVSQQVDAIFSNAALHWILDADGCVASMSRALRAGGRFVIEMGGQGNIDQIMSALMDSVAEIGIGIKRPPKFYPSPGEYERLLRKYGIEPSRILHFTRPTKLEGVDGLRNWYMQFAQLVLEQLSADDRDEVILRAENKLRPTHYDGNNWTADYVRLRVTAQKQ